MYVFWVESSGDAVHVGAAIAVFNHFKSHKFSFICIQILQFRMCIKLRFYV